MNGPRFLARHTGKLVTSAGAFFPGERVVFRGQDLHSALKDLDWLELYLYGITGRRFSDRHMRILHAMCTYTSYPDARLWNNRVAALAGSARSTSTLAIASALALSEAQIYGRGVDLRASEFLIRAKREVDGGADLCELVSAEIRRQRGIAGFGRPVVSADERIKPMLELLYELGFERGPHLSIAYAIEEILLTGRWRLRMNYAALAAAICADFGMSSYEYLLSSLPAFVAGMPPCYMDAAEKSEQVLFPLSCQSIRYEGVVRRTWRRNKVGSNSTDRKTK